MKFRCGRRQHAGFWELLGRIKEVGWMNIHLTIRQGIAAGFMDEWIVGNSYADKLADVAMHTRIDPTSGDTNNHDDHIKEVRARVQTSVRTFERVSK